MLVDLLDGPILLRFADRLQFLDGKPTILDRRLLGLSGIEQNRLVVDEFGGPLSQRAHARTIFIFPKPSTVPNVPADARNVDDVVAIALDKAPTIANVGFRLKRATLEDLVRRQFDGQLFRLRLRYRQGVRVHSSPLTCNFRHLPGDFGR
ncbi:hypothetical protein IB279_02830 [Ensifer sp. ENS06]|nr:hypothetical protein [Ensifer sp. ENS06]